MSEVASAETTAANNGATTVPTMEDVMKEAARLDAANGTTPDDGEQQPAAATTGGKPDASQEKKDVKTEAGAQAGAGEKKGEGKDDKKPDEKKPDDKAETPFAKAKKERERQENLLKNFQQEKETFRAERQALTAEVTGLRREVAELRQKSQTAAKPATDANGATAEDYDRLAKKYHEDGNTDMEKLATARAEAMRKQAPSQAAVVAGETSNTPEFKAAWNEEVQKLIGEDAALADPKNPLVAAANLLTNDPTWGRFFKAHPQGIRAAVEVARLMQSANASKELQTKLTTAEDELKTSKAEVTRLNGLLQPRGGQPSAGPATPKSGAQMNEAEILRLAAAADEQGLKVF